jgi:hypothetical protein
LPGSGATAFRKHSFPGRGQMKREQMELARLRRDVGEVLRRDRQETIDEPWQTLIGWLGQARGCDRTALETRFKPPAHLAVRLPASHMTVSQAGPTGSMTPWR